ncbi:hypothetical protein CEK26_008485 [Fusarium fujikuroi]|uniref:Uncharacterized protein n=1 Tax=Fusarium fujikuroi TaxID=5127 RepID=A0A5Q3ES52_FUSFU|nr:hypothetical protein CEK27_008502 [Fusarium fujikuroi]QGI81791.1 hypothetical protein CEK25_008520 [Fusarium fujikuroi]QGI95416.1 hypothetical protein CEK26_008485 [Fusarium fujikuroi]VTT70866.1 unnamed protein product [Fusarium fujikuroi]VTT71664.1 unnamed protein product [Fusarium fujikuroi]
MASAVPRRRKLIGQRRRVEDEGEDEAGPETLDLDDDSITDGSLTDDNDPADDSDTSNIDEASPTSPNVRRKVNGAAKQAGHGHKSGSGSGPGQNGKPVTDTDVMLHGLSITDQSPPVQEMHFDEVVAPSPSKSPAAPIVVSSASARPPAAPANRRRQEHEDYKRKRDEDPAFVPNREPAPTARPRHMVEQEGPANGNGFIPTCDPNPTPINRTLSTEKHIGNAQVRVSLPSMTEPVVIPRLAVKQYTKLPDHRPPLRRDKPVRISLPNNPPRYIYPAADRSFIFIPRAMRPNQQRMRGKPRSGFGSMGGFSRRTSVFGGSYYGSVYSPSVAMSRRSSIVDRDYMFSPTGSVISRPPIPVENTRPVVRLPPAPRPEMPINTMVPSIAAPASAYGPADPALGVERSHTLETSINDLPPPQTYPLPQKPAFQENRPTSALPMHQPRPQKNISVADIESPTLTQGPQAYQQAFHQQVPVQMVNGLPQDSHTRQPSYPSQHSTGTPLSQIPERAIHAAPFQPNTYGQQPYYNQQPYQAQPQQGYYYPPNYNPPNMGPPSTAPAFVPSQSGPPGSFTPQNQPEQPVMSNNGPPPAPGSSLVVQEANGMVYYFDASQLPPVTNYSGYPAPQGYQPSVMGMGGMVTPSPDGFYYPQQTSGMVYYPQ